MLEIDKLKLNFTKKFFDKLNTNNKVKKKIQVLVFCLSIFSYILENRKNNKKYYTKINSNLK